MRHPGFSLDPLGSICRWPVATLCAALTVVSSVYGAVAATCDPPGPPPRFGCQWSVTDCAWFCPICDPFGAPPRTSCTWDLTACNWICPGYTGVDVMVRTLQSPSQDTAAYVRLSSLCATTGSLARCDGNFAVHPGMSLATKCESIADAISANCSGAGYVVTANNCAAAASLTASNVGCPGTQFALGISNDPGVFDQTAAGPLPDGEVESICAPSPGSVGGLRVAKLGDASGLQLTWGNVTNAGNYLLFESQAASGSFDSVAGTTDNGTTSLTIAMPPGSEFFLVASSNSSCGVGPKE